jgi:uncharacterized protein YndB with AHSA1/START domain
MSQETIHIETIINAPVAKVWDAFNNPEAIRKWNHASDDWHCPASENDLREGGRFKNTMAAKDGSFSFDFEGTYTKVELHKEIGYSIADGRTVAVFFYEKDGQTHLKESFEAEDTHSGAEQKAGWQAILDNFKKYVENNS